MPQVYMLLLLLLPPLASSVITARENKPANPKLPKTWRTSEPAPDFMLCDTDPKCGGEGIEGRIFTDTLDLVIPHSFKEYYAGRKPTFIHIGAEQFANQAKYADLGLWSKVFAKFKLANGKYKIPFRLVLVEPGPQNMIRLKRRLKKLNLPNGTVEIVNSVIYEKCHHNDTEYYTLNDQFEKEFGYPAAVTLRGMSGNSWKRLARIAPKIWTKHCNETGDCRPELVRGANMSNFSNYVIQYKIKCDDPEGLLEKIGVDPRSVAMLVVDAEGADAGIISRFLDIPKFNPAVVEFEAAGWEYDSELAKTVRKLGDFGYSTGAMDNSQSGDGADAVAIRKVGAPKSWAKFWAVTPSKP